MKESQNIRYKDSVFKKLGSAQDNFFLGPNISKISITSENCKTCILSYNINKDSCGVAVNIYGIIITELVYFIENQCQKCNSYFVTPFNQCIYMPDNKCKISSLSVSMQNKYFNKIRECSVAAFFTLMFHVKLCIPVCDECQPSCVDEIKDFKCVNTVTINTDICDDLDCCEDYSYDRRHDCTYDAKHDCKPRTVTNDKAPIDYNNQSSKLRNDMYKYLTSFQQNNRL